VSLLNYILGIAAAQAQVASQANDVANNTGNELTKLIANFLASIPLWIAAIVVAFFSYILAVIVKKALESKLAEQGIEEEHKEIKIVAGRSAFFGVLVIGITVSLSIVGIDLKPIVAAGAFGLGFALQDIIMNLISGMFILASRHYTIGDVITVSGVTGRIEEIQTRATIIKAFDGTKVVVPNSELFSNVVISKTSNPYRKLSFVMGVGYDASLKEVMELTLAVVKSIPWVLKKPKPSVIFTEWGDYSINFKINVWIDSKGGKFVKVKNRVIMDLTKAYDEAGFNIPYPIQTVLMDKADETEIKQEEISNRVKALKAKYKAKNVDPSTLAAPVLSTLTAAPAMVAAAQSEITAGVTAAPAPAAPIVEQPVPAPVSTPANPAVLPVAIQTTPNSPGQSWLQQALTQQVASTATIPAPAPTPAEAPVAPVAPAQSNPPPTQ
jgi:small-conductance mechanosensitive channel